MASLASRVALVTGSTSGIGRGIAEHFAEIGAQVVITGRDSARGDQVLRAIRKKGGQAAFRAGDLTSSEACQALVGFTLKCYGKIDVLVNNAGDISRGTIEDTGIDTFDRQIAINLRAPFILLQAVIPHMKGRGGSIINIGSVNAYIGEPKLCSYSISKGGLMTLTKNAASYLNRYRIRVNQLNVGWTLTEGEERIKREEEQDPDWLSKALQTRPFGRLLTPADIAYAAAYFASNDGECITGSVLDLEQYPVGAPPNW
jgi:hypothetical protein